MSRSFRFVTVLVALATLLMISPGVDAFHFPWDQGHDTCKPETPAPPPESCDKCNATGSPFVVATGSYTLTQEDVFIPGRIPLQITRHYHSGDLHNGMFGHGWTFNYGLKVIEVTNGLDHHLILRRANGQRDRFLRKTDGHYSSPADVFDVLEKNPDGTFTLTTRDRRSFRFDSSGNLDSIRDHNGNSLALDYDEAGFLASVTDDNGRALTFTKGASGKIESITDPASRIFRFEYDAGGNLTVAVDPMGGRTRYSYDSKGNLIRITDPRQNLVTSITYDSVGRVATYTDQGETYRLSYTPSQKKVIETDSRGNTRILTYNDNINVTSITDALGGLEQLGYDPHFNVSSIRDKNGNQTTFTYDDRGNVTSVTDAQGRQAVYTYDSTFNQVSSITDPAGNTTRYEYDARGNLARVIDALGQTTEYRYNESGDVVEVVDAAGKVTRRGYDKNGYLTEIVDPAGHVTSRSFDAAGHLISATDSASQSHSFEFDVNGRLTRAADATGSVTLNSYDANGNLTAVTDPTNQTTTIGYDSFNRVTQVTNPMGQSRSLSYDGKGNLVRMTDPKGQVMDLTYDALNRLIRKQLPGNTMTYTYDKEDNLLSVADNDTLVTFTYDSLHQVTRTQANIAGQPPTVVSYTYSALGQRASMTDPLGGVTTYSYDGGGRLQALVDPAGEVTSFSYDALSRRTRMTLGNGVVAGTSYDEGGRILSHSHTAAAGALFRFDYSYDALGNRTSIQDLASTVQATYDPLSRLTAAIRSASPSPAESYSYNANGDRTASHLSPAYTYNAAHRLLEDQDFSYSYDANGNLTSKSSKVTGEITRYTYDAEDQLTRIDFAGGGFVAYRYDGLGRRAEKNVGVVITRFVYDGDDLLTELDADNNAIARYTYGPEVDEPIVLRRGGSTFYYHADALGSIVGLSDASGTTVQTYTYDSFGQILAEVGSVQQPFRFTAREWDTESGMYYYRARYYDPRSGRFITEDPLQGRFFSNQPGLATSVELRRYLYAENNPLNFKDPTGLFTVDASCSKAPFSTQAVTDAANDALDKIKNSNCIKKNSLKKKLINVFNKMTIKCSQSLSACGEAPIKPVPGAKVTLGPSAMNPSNCGPLGSTILHEAVHNTQWIGTEKKPRSCEKSCYGWDPDNKYCADDCK